MLRRVVVRDVVGKIVSEKTITSIDNTTINLVGNSGVYFVEVHSGDQKMQSIRVLKH